MIAELVWRADKEGLAARASEQSANDLAEWYAAKNGGKGQTQIRPERLSRYLADLPEDDDN